MQGQVSPRQELMYDELPGASRGADEQPVLKAAKRGPHATSNAIRYFAFPHLAAAVPEVVLVHAQDLLSFVPVVNGHCSYPLLAYCRAHCPGHWQLHTGLAANSALTRQGLHY